MARAHTAPAVSPLQQNTHKRAHSGPCGVGRWLTTSRGFFPPQGNLVCFLGANLATCPLGLTPQIRRFQIPRKESTFASHSKVPSLGREDPLEEGMAPHSLQYSCLENPMDRGAWRATVHGVAKSRTPLKRLGMQYLPHPSLSLSFFLSLSLSLSHTHTHTHINEEHLP